MLTGGTRARVRCSFLHLLRR